MQSTLSRFSPVWLRQVLGLAALYTMTGWLSLLLAIPPGYSMAVYPPAGIALGLVLVHGYRVLPGVMLGSFLVNLFIAYQNTHQITGLGLLLAVLLAGGACLQAWVSSYLIKKFLNGDLALNTDRAIFSFFFYGGALGCLCSASIGILSLYSLGVLPAAAVPGNWSTWWLGDTLGVLTISPIVLILYARPKAIWASRRWNVMLPLLLCLILVVTAFLFIRDREQQKQKLEFKLEAERIAQTLQNKLNNHADAVKYVERLYASDNSVSRADFATFVAPTLARHTDITALAWAPQISRQQRAAFELRMVKEGLVDFHFSELDAQKMPIVAAQRNEYYPVTYFAPFDASSLAFGYDMGSDTARRNAIEDARDSGELTATDPVILNSKLYPQKAILLYAPLYARGLSIDTNAQRQLAFTGVAVSVFLVEKTIQALISEEQKKYLLLKFYDLSYPSEKGIFFNKIVQLDSHYLHQTSIDFGGRQYALQIQPSDLYWKQHVSWITWVSMVGGLLFSGLLGIYLLVSTSHTYNVELLVTQRTAELHDKEERLQAILSNAAEGILTIDADGKIESANQSAEKLLRYPLGGLRGRDIFELFPEPAAQTLLRRYLEKNTLQENTPTTGTISALANRHEVQAHTGDARSLPLELAISTVELRWQTLLVAMLHDLTEEKRVEKLKSEFVSAVSHELRTPLTSIRGVLGLLVGGIGGELPQQSQILLKMANDNAVRLTTLINDLLDFEKLEYGGMQFNLAPVSLLDLLEKTRLANLGYAQNFKVSLTLSAIANEDICVMVDPQRFIQVLSNLLSNAIKFSHENGQVELRMGRQGGKVKIEVQDYGVGISEEFKNSIFQKFSQEDAKAARKYAGTGLGLSLAKNMIEKMNGKIGFISREGYGSIFFLELPIVNNASSIPASF